MRAQHSKKDKAHVLIKSKPPRISNQVRIDPKNPIPFDFTGKAFSVANESYYYPLLSGKDDFARNLLETKLLSITHLACIITKKDYCGGVGLQDAQGDKLPKQLLDWLTTINLKNQSFVKVNRLMFDSHFTFGNTPIEIVRFTVGKEKKLYVYVHSLLEWRLAVPEDGSDLITHAIYSKTFLRQSFIQTNVVKDARKVPLYNPLKTESENWVKGPNGAEHTLIWLKEEFIGFPTYGLPSSVASMITQLLEYKGGRYDLDMFDNNLVAASILALRGNLSDQEANRIGKKIIDQHSGDGKRGRTVVVSSEEGIDGSDIHNLDTKKDGNYIEASDKWGQKIILANQWDSVLAGLISPSTLGKGSGFLTKIIEFKFKSVIQPAQQNMMAEVWNHVLKIWSDWYRVPLDSYDIEIKNNIDISGLTDVDITEAVTVNEVRKSKGLPVDPKKEGSYMKENKAVGKEKKQNKKGGTDV